MHKRLLFIVCLTTGVLVASLADAKVRVASRPAASETPISAVGYKLSGECCPAPAPECKVYKPCVSYRGSTGCGPTVKQVLRVQDPCDCCCTVAEIPVCLPACCKNPCVSSKCGRCGRGVVWYDYDCGVCVKILFRKCGDVVVLYRG